MRREFSHAQRIAKNRIVVYIWKLYIQKFWVIVRQNFSNKKLCFQIYFVHFLFQKNCVQKMLVLRLTNSTGFASYCYIFCRNFCIKWRNCLKNYHVFNQSIAGSDLLYYCIHRNNLYIALKMAALNGASSVMDSPCLSVVDSHNYY